MSPSLDGTWAYTVLHTFLGEPGRYPGSLIFDGAGHLYGTTESCGSRAKCMGIVFELRRPGRVLGYLLIDRHCTQPLLGPSIKLFSVFGTHSARLCSARLCMSAKVKFE
jgi:hypothetical protein